MNAADALLLDHLLGRVQPAPKPVPKPAPAPATPVPSDSARPLRGAALRAALTGRADRPDWPDHWFAHGADPGDVTACRHLWAAVLMHSLGDILRTWLIEARRLMRDEGAAWPDACDAARIRNTSWLESRDFAEVCHLAGLDPQAIRNSIRAQAATEARLADLSARFFGKMKDKPQRGEG